MRSRLLLTLSFSALFPAAAEPVQLSGIHPHLAFFNDEGECGTGAVVPWADRLWVVTYAPHKPKGSSDKLYEITPGLELIVRPESVGGTPANRMIHRESRQLFIGPHAIDEKGDVRTISYAEMFGRPTANARHLTDPAGKIHYATMEEGLYEVDVRTLQVTELFRDEHLDGGRKADLPGYHGKGLYSAQGQLIYANNGERGEAAKTRPDTPSGVLASWDGKSDTWEIIRRNQFTEVTGPGGIYGNDNPDTDPLWTMGWDHKSVLLMLLDKGTWHTFRLPKGSHSYDGAHGWNTEWPRIREIGEGDRLLATMHGTFWAFPKTFSAKNTAGIAPRSNYLKVIGDFCRWNDHVVFGCDDTAKNEFLNKRKAKGRIAAPQSQSNLWFVKPGQIDHLGPAIGRGALWMNEDIAAGTVSEPFLIAGYDRKSLHLSRAPGGKESRVTIEVDADGKGSWEKIREVELTSPSTWFDLTDVKGEWLRLTASTALSNATAMFHLSMNDARGTTLDPIFAGLAAADEKELTGGLVRARGDNKRTLAFAAIAADGSDIGCYELHADLTLKPATEPDLHEHVKTHTRIPVGVVSADAASVVFIDDDGKRWRLPKGDPAFGHPGPLGDSRAAREVATERDLFHAHGTFYELPANNAGGFSKLRPVATHNLRIHDFCSYRGLFIMTGISNKAPQDNPHIIRSSDGKAALWAGAIDDIWAMGKPRGTGGPWFDTPVKAGQPSDPYLATGYDIKSLELSHHGKSAVTIRLEADFTGNGSWQPVRSFNVPASETLKHDFPAAFAAYWFRLVTEQDTTATAAFTYR
ncbi:MAG TPA: hypothetical protein VLO11_08425 [Luteolibacter sp.]|nr:hypothetical protein [Luteolibacter sp.]